ncbi:MAG: clostripain-related cysteine peptidase [Brevinematia bacterium]
MVIRLIFMVLIVFVTLVVGCTLSPVSPAGNTNTNTNISNVPKSWTILIHMAIDNDIDYEYEANFNLVSYYLQTLKFLKAKDFGNKVEILVLMDSYNYETNGYETKFKDGYYRIKGSGSISSDLVVPKSEINSGSVLDIKGFINWVIGNYPATNYIYIIFNHGNGFVDLNEEGRWLGIAFDDIAGDSLSLSEIGQVTKYLATKVGKKIDLFYPFACLMGGIELAYEVKDSVSYLLFSEELFPADFWSFEALELIITNPSSSAEDVGKMFCNSAYQYFSNSGRSFTLALLKLDNVDGVKLAIDNYADAITNYITNFQNALLLNKVAFSNSIVGSFLQPLHCYIDLKGYVKAVKQSITNSDIQTLTQGILDAIDSLIVYKKILLTNDLTFYFPDFTNYSGLSIFHNVVERQGYPEELYFSIIRFGIESKWRNYLSVLSNYLRSPDFYEPDDTQAQARAISIGETQTRTLHSQGDVDWIIVSNVSGRAFVMFSSSDGDILYGELYDADSMVKIDYGDVDKVLEFIGDGGNYYIKVTSRSSRKGVYTVAMSTIGEDDYEPDNSFASAKEINVGAFSQERSFHVEGDVDFIKVYLTGSKAYKIETYQWGLITDTELTLYDSYYSQVAYNNDANGVYSVITFTPSSTGWYYIKVNEYKNDDVGKYKINVVEY